MLEPETAETAQNAEQPKARKKTARRKDVYTPAELADELNITRRTVYNWITSKQIPAVKLGVKLWGIRGYVVQALKDGRDPWRAENGYQGSVVKKMEETARPVVEDENSAAAESAALLQKLRVMEAEHIADAAMTDIFAPLLGGVAPKKNAGANKKPSKGRRS